MFLPHHLLNSILESMCLAFKLSISLFKYHQRRNLCLSDRKIKRGMPTKAKRSTIGAVNVKIVNLLCNSTFMRSPYFQSRVVNAFVEIFYLYWKFLHQNILMCIVIIFCDKNDVILVWGGNSNINMERILKHKKRAVRCLLGLNAQESCREAYKDHTVLVETSFYIWEVIIHAGSTLLTSHQDLLQHNTKHASGFVIPNWWTKMQRGLADSTLCL